MACAALTLGVLSLGHAQDTTQAQRDRAAFNTAEVVYLTLVGEIEVQSGEAGAGYSLILTAAKKSGDADLFRRAIQVALQAHSGESALDAAKAWAAAQPKDPEPLRVQLQILLRMQRIEDTATPLGRLLDLTPGGERAAALDALGQLYSQARDPQAALKVFSVRTRPWRDSPVTAASALAALARVQSAAGQDAEAARSLQKALNEPLPSVGAGLLAVEWLDGPVPVREEWIAANLAQHPGQAPVRLAYARHLVRKERLSEAQQQLEQLTTGLNASQSPPESWLLLGALQLQAKRLDAAQSSFQTYLNAPGVASDPRHARGRDQAYLSLAQIAEEQQRPDEARAWLDRVNMSDDPLRVQTRRARLLVKAGRWQEAVELIRSVPDNPDDGNRARTLAEVQVLQDAGQLPLAFDRLAEAIAKMPGDPDLLYEQATLAERMGRHDDMEQLMREVLRLKPDHAHALNFLGYSLADRNLRLPEAKALITRALELAPGDPFITDSLGWVEYRMGNLDAALKALSAAYQARQDAEIATHLGEVLWVMGQREAAMKHFREAQALQPDNEVLKQTIKRLGVPW